MIAIKQRAGPGWLTMRAVDPPVVHRRPASAVLKPPAHLGFGTLGNAADVCIPTSSSINFAMAIQAFTIGKQLCRPTSWPAPEPMQTFNTLGGQSQQDKASGWPRAFCWRFSLAQENSAFSKCTHLMKKLILVLAKGWGPRSPNCLCVYGRRNALSSNMDGESSSLLQLRGHKPASHQQCHSQAAATVAGGALKQRKVLGKGTVFPDANLNHGLCRQVLELSDVNSQYSETWSKASRLS